MFVQDMGTIGFNLVGGDWNMFYDFPYPIGSMYGIYANIGGILMLNVTIYSIHGSYGYIGNVILPTDELHHFSEGLVETTN